MGKAPRRSVTTWPEGPPEVESGGLSWGDVAQSTPTLVHLPLWSSKLAGEVNLHGRHPLDDRVALLVPAGLLRHEDVPVLIHRDLRVLWVINHRMSSLCARKVSPASIRAVLRSRTRFARFTAAVQSICFFFLRLTALPPSPGPRRSGGRSAPGTPRTHPPSRPSCRSTESTGLPGVPRSSPSR